MKEFELRKGDLYKVKWNPSWKQRDPLPPSLAVYHGLTERGHRFVIEPNKDTMSFVAPDNVDEMVTLYKKRTRYSPDFNFFCEHQVVVSMTNSRKHWKVISRMDGTKFYEVHQTNEPTNDELREKLYEIHKSLKLQYDE